MHEKVEKKFKKWMDIFDKIAIETGMKNKDPQQLFNIEEMNSDNDFENTTNFASLQFAFNEFWNTLNPYMRIWSPYHEISILWKIGSTKIN